MTQRKNPDPDHGRDDKAIEAMMKFQGTAGIWEKHQNNVVSQFMGWIALVAANVDDTDNALICQAKPLLEFSIKHLAELKACNEFGNWTKEIEELTAIIGKALGHDHNN